MTDSLCPRALFFAAALLAAAVSAPGDAAAQLDPGSALNRSRALSTPPGGSPRARPDLPASAREGRETAQADCSGAAAQASAESGGRVLHVSSQQEGGRTACVVVVLLPGENGGQPRRDTITIPQ